MLKLVKRLIDSLDSLSLSVRNSNNLYEAIIKGQKEATEKLDRLANLNQEVLERLTGHLATEMQIKKEEHEDKMRRSLESIPTGYDEKY